MTEHVDAVARFWTPGQGCGDAAVGSPRAASVLAGEIRIRRRAALVVNVASRRGARHYRRVRELLADGLELVEVRPVAQPDQLPAALGAALYSGAELVVVGGGDGTLSEAAHQLAHRDRCLGVLPLGTTNNFARGLRVPLNLAGAVRTLTTGRVAEIDLGYAAGRHFTNLASQIGRASCRERV